MKRLSLFFAISALLILEGCGSVPVTGRKQLSLVPNQDVLTLSFQQYSEFIDAAPLSSKAQQTAMVKKVGLRISAAVEKYLRDNGMAAEVANYKWEFNLVKSAEVNAFCMPGGKIVIYEGILPVTQNETGLAVVMGHEVAHAVAKHANERMSQQMVAEKGSALVGQAMSAKSPLAQRAASAIMGVGVEGTLKKYSRNHELEADHLGLIFMSMAGYDPNQAADFWLRMSKLSGGGGGGFFGTHPSDDTRVKKIKEHLPEAMKYYTGKANVGTQNAKTSEKWSF